MFIYQIIYRNAQLFNRLIPVENDLYEICKNQSCLTEAVLKQKAVLDDIETKEYKNSFKGVIIMTFLQGLKEWNLKLNNRKKSIFSVDVSKQKAYLASLPEPIDLFERSYFQNKCQNMMNGRIHTFLYNFASLLMFYPMMRKFRKNAKKILPTMIKSDAVSSMDFRGRGLLPNELDARLKVIANFESVSGRLDREEWRFIKSLMKRYPFSPYFVFKCACRVAIYADAIEKYSPQVILAYAEYSFTSSVLTEFCRKKGVEHINIMHGEKLFDINDAFFAFDKCYVWDTSYISLFRKMRAASDQFVISIPNAMCFNCESIYVDEDSRADYKYYLAQPDSQELITIADALERLYTKGFRVKVRPHPLLLNISYIERFFARERIELPSEVPIEKSVAGTEYVISEYSTVLNQAYNSGKQIIIDDIANPDRYTKLQRLDYIMFSKPHLRLSKVI